MRVIILPRLLSLVFCISSAPHPPVVILPSVSCDVLFSGHMEGNRIDRLFQTCSVFERLRKKMYMIQGNRKD